MLCALDFFLFLQSVCFLFAPWRAGRTQQDITKQKVYTYNVNKESFLHNLIFTVNGYFLFKRILYIYIKWRLVKVREREIVLNKAPQSCAHSNTIAILSLIHCLKVSLLRNANAFRMCFTLKIIAQWHYSQMLNRKVFSESKT